NGTNRILVAGNNSGVMDVTGSLIYNSIPNAYYGFQVMQNGQLNVYGGSAFANVGYNGPPDYTGLYLASDGNYINGLDLYTGYGGIYLFDSHDNVINNLYIESGDYPIRLDFSSDNQFSNIWVDGYISNSVDTAGLRLDSSDFNTFTNLNFDPIYGSGMGLYGLYSSWSDYNTFNGITFGDLYGSNQVEGLRFHESDHNIIDTITLGNLMAGGSASAYGIDIGSGPNSWNNTLTTITIGNITSQGGTIYGIYLYGMGYNTVTGATIGNLNSTIGGGGGGAGEPQPLGVGGEEPMIGPTPAVYGIFFDGMGSTGNTVTGITIGDMYSDTLDAYGIYFSDGTFEGEVSYATIGNILADDEDAYGMYLWGSYYGNLNNINIGHVTGYYYTEGIRLHDSTENILDTITVGDVFSMTDYPVYGINVGSGVSSSGNSLSSITVGDVESSGDLAYGIYLYGSGDNTINGATVGDVDSPGPAWGIYIDGPSTGNSVTGATVGNVYSGFAEAFGVYVNMNAYDAQVSSSTIGHVGSPGPAYGINCEVQAGGGAGAAEPTPLSAPPEGARPLEAPPEGATFNGVTVGDVDSFSAMAYGIYLPADSIGNTFTDTTIGDIEADFDAYGMYLGSVADFNSFTRTTIGDVDSWGSTSAYGMYLFDAWDNAFTDTTIGTVYGHDTSAYGIYMDTIDGATFYRTVVGDVFSDGGSAKGVYMYGVEGIRFTETNIGNIGSAEVMGPTAYGIHVDGWTEGGQDNSDIVMSITTIGDVMGIETDAYGMRIAHTADSTFWDTTIGDVWSRYEFGDFTAYGLRISSFSDNVNVFNTIIGDVTGNGTSAYGARISSSVTNSTIDTITIGDVYSSQPMMGPTAYGLRLSGTENTVSNAYIGDVTGEGTTAYGIRLSGSMWDGFNDTLNYGNLLDTIVIGDITSTEADTTAYGVYLGMGNVNNTLNTIITGHIFGNCTTAYGIYITQTNGSTVSGFWPLSISSTAFLPPPPLGKGGEAPLVELPPAGESYGLYTAWALNNQFTNNRFIRTGIGVYLDGESGGNTFTSNTIRDNLEWNVYVAQMGDVNMPNTCWGTADTTIIDALINDGNDNGEDGAPGEPQPLGVGAGIVNYMPIDTSVLCVGAPPGGGGSSGGGTPPGDDGESHGSTIFGITAGTPTNFIIPPDGCATVAGVELTTTKDYSSGKVTTTCIGDTPPSGIPPLDNSYGYFEMEITVDPNDISGDITVTFTVDMAWLEANGFDPSTVMLNRWNNGQWESYPATMVETGDGFYTFTATVPGFSVFTITAGEEEPVTPPPVTPPVAPPVEPTPPVAPPADGGEEEITEAAFNYLWVGVIVVLVIIAIAIVAVWQSRKPKIRL
ncbi:MAG: PGF-pre-PGF domain-containing protein, partial [Candidatus Thorarchaeota archaeon]